jgi:hypothetical protein
MVTDVPETTDSGVPDKVTGANGGAKGVTVTACVDEPLNMDTGWTR